MDMQRLGNSRTQVLVIGLSAASVDAVIKTYSAGHNIKITHVEDAWSAGFEAKECSPNLILINPIVAGIDKQAIIKSLAANGSCEPLIVEVVNNSQNGLNMSREETDSKEVIRQAVQQLLSA